jgi:hypothetical protein
MLRQARMGSLLAIGLLAGTGASAQEVLERLPNIVALPAFNISASVNIIYHNPELRFSVTTGNLGDGVLEYIGGETGQGKQNIYQRIYLSDGSYYDRRVGSFVWHPEHNHIHVEKYAEYVLQALNAKGNSKRIGQKTSFCVMDTDRIDPHAGPAFYTTCDATVQGMSVGWADTYGSHLPGQEIDLTGLPDGDYTLTVVADPQGRLSEITTSDNTSCVLLNITGIESTPSVTVLNDSGCDAGGGGSPPGGVSVSGLSPQQGAIGDLVPITITGTGLTDSLGVSFENGSGAKLTVTDVSASGDGTRIDAILTISKRGNPRNPDTLWDLRVGDAVLPDAFLVIP